MTLRVCLDCTTGFAVGVPRCPHCGSERHAEEGSAAALGLHPRGRIEEDTMPKITVHGGASDRADIPPEPEAPAAEGGEQPSAETAPEAPVAEAPRAAKKTTSGRRKPARTAKTATSEQDTE